MDIMNKCFKIQKGHHHYIIWFKEGREYQLYLTLIEYGKSTDFNLTVMDALKLIREITDGAFNTEAQKIMKSEE